MKKHLACKATSIVAAITLWQMTGMAALTTNTIFEQNFDSDTVGQLPSGWTGLPAVNNEAFVTSAASASAPNSFNVGIQPDGSSPYTVTKSFPAHDLANGDPDNRLSYSLDINVQHIDNNDGEGIVLRPWNGVSLISVGSPRIVRNGTQWRFYNPNYPFTASPTHVGNFNTNQWYNFRVVINPSTPSTGTALWYMDGALINTETYGQIWLGPTQTSNIDTFDILHETDSNPATGALMYFDNFVIQAIIPEPSSTALMAAGGLLVWRRRKTAVE